MALLKVTIKKMICHNRVRGSFSLPLPTTPRLAGLLQRRTSAPGVSQSLSGRSRIVGDLCDGDLWDVPQFISLYRQEMNIDFLLQFSSCLYTNSERNRWREDLGGFRGRESSR
jgi:hypothetical protein